MPRHQPLPPPLRRGAFSTATAREHGVGAGRLRGRDLAKPFHGARVDGDATSVHARCVAAQALLGEGVAFAGPTAAMLLGAPLPRELETGDIHVAVSVEYRGPRRRGIRTRRLQRLSTRRVGRFTVTTPERTWCDLAADLELDDLVAAGDHLLRVGLVTVDSLTAAIADSRGGRGVPRMRDALPLLDGRAESRRESRLRVLVVMAGLTGFTPNLTVRVAGFRHRIDLAFPREMVAIEYLGDHHRDPLQWQRDIARRGRLESAGWLVIEVSAEDLRHPEDLLRRIRMALAARS